MPREIKFRAWDRKKKKLHRENCMVHLYDDEVRVFNRERGYEIIPFLECDIIQYTGLKDKNGKEIYEGDICRHNDGSIFPIDYRGFGFHPFTCYGDTLSIYYGLMNTDCEVIGNIYENSNLLDKQTNE